MGMNTDHRQPNPAPVWPGPSNDPASPVPLAPARRRRWPWILIAAAVALALVVGVVVLLARDSRLVVATASTSSGSVEISSGADAGFEPLADGESVRLGDLVRTGDGARLTLTLADGSLFRLGEKAQAAFEAPEPGKSVLRLVEGAAWYRHTTAEANLVLEVATKTATVGGKPAVTALDCGANGACTVHAIAGSVDLIPVDGSPLGLAPGERASLDEQGSLTEVTAVGAESDLPPWVIENQEADRAAGLADPTAPEDRVGILAQARVQGTWSFTLTITESTADNFSVGDAPVFDMDLVSSCPEGPCAFEATFDRYTGTGSQAEDAMVAFSVGAPLQCVSTASGAVTDPDNGPESLTFELRATAAEVRAAGLVITALVGTARYDKNAEGPCRPGDQVGPAFAVMEVTGTLS